MKNKLKLLILEPYYGGSHKHFIDGYLRHTKHEVELLTMPARKWKWRMRGAAMYFANEIKNKSYDVLFVCDFINLAELIGMLPAQKASVPKIVYFHENQLTYPVPDESTREYEYSFTNITTCLAADKIVFNSEYHRQCLINGAQPFINRMSDFVPKNISNVIANNSVVISPGIEWKNYRSAEHDISEKTGSPLILWNHRWEFDKNPQDFFNALYKLSDEGIDFKLAVLGENFRKYPKVFDEAREKLQQYISHWGYVRSREDYLSWLCKSDIIVSTAIHEFFGIAIVEAIVAGCYPILPDRLAYPFVLPKEFHKTHIYKTNKELFRKLRNACTNLTETRSVDISQSFKKYDWTNIASQLDSLFEEEFRAGTSV